MTSRVLALLAVSSFVGGSAGEPLSVRVPAISMSIMPGNAQTTPPPRGIVGGHVCSCCQIP